MKMYSIDSRFVLGPSNILFAGVYVCTFQPGHFTGWGGEGVNIHTHSHLIRISWLNISSEDDNRVRKRTRMRKQKGNKRESDEAVGSNDA